ncbi:MAG: hypothetical protein DRI90_03885 [Deltaproteobacteria bacterium]|nr:MAG: hypothetical protein DRI90_03885 [Deltaproteobacteria bacterium]
MGGRTAGPSGAIDDLRRSDLASARFNSMPLTGTVGDAAPSERDWRALARPRAGLLAVLVLAATIAGRAGSWWWVFDLASHFALQLAIAGAFACVLSLWAQGPRWAAVAGVSLIANMVVVLPVYVGGAESIHRGSEVRLISYNLNATNPETDTVIQYLRSSQCDLVFALEVTPEWLRVLKTLEPAYRVDVAEPRADNFGIALLSRGLKVSARILRAPKSDVGFVEARVTVDGNDWFILGVHPVPPLGADLAAERDTALEFIASWAAQQNGPVVVLGDLNITPFSPSFSRLLARGKLVNSQRGYGVQATWPQFPWFMLPGRIPIDHALHSRDVVTRGRSLGPAMGSDHLPLVVKVALPAK